MEELLVLGKIPNTSVMISFTDWLLLAILPLAVLVLVRNVSHIVFGIRAYLLKRRAYRLLVKHSLI